MIDRVLLIILLIVALCVLVTTVAILVAIRRKRASGSIGNDALDNVCDEIKDGTADIVKNSERVITEAVKMGLSTQSDSIDKYMNSIRQLSQDTYERIAKGFDEIKIQLNSAIKDMTLSVENQLEKVRRETGEQLEKVRLDNEMQLEKVRQDNEIQLGKMRDTVDEKLSKTLNDRLTQSFQSVQTSLDNVNKGLGEMKELSVNVRDINKIMSGVKTRGIWGEQALGALLEEILVPEQYYQQHSIKRGSSEKVDFAIRMPGSGNEEVLLPIDCKFPSENYMRLAEASERGDTAAMEFARKALCSDVLAQGRSIRDKYISPPKTTDFAVMYLPSEGLYAEIIRATSTVDKLRKDYNVIISGPSTMTALLNSLQMGFRSLKIQKSSLEVQKAFVTFGKNFTKFTELIGKAQEQNITVAKTLDKVQDRNKKIQEHLDKINRNNPMVDAMSSNDNLIGGEVAADTFGDGNDY
ncbi:MAG: DNA recombination protein RmuC [Clostridia bacterium]|nr:DNA recombination protein RmuC [Clostridia bacterium]